MTLPFSRVNYEDNHECVSWRGDSFSAGEELDAFLTKQVFSRLDDEEGEQDFRVELQGLSLTGMGTEYLEKVLKAKIPESRDWAAGEALSEAYLIECYGVVFPWNMERDKRNPFASLPGADLVGFIKQDDGTFRLALGEVKTSSENKYPPQVMYGRGGMIHQLDNLASDLVIIRQLLKWLLPRTRKEPYKNVFKNSCITFFNSQAKAITLFGVLIRDTAPNEQDLQKRGQSLRDKLELPSQCQLVALYLPWSIEELIPHIRKGGVE
jgi:hypothetical protein